MTFWAGAQILLLAVMAAVIARLTLSLWPGFGKAKTVTPEQAAADATQVLLWCETADGQVIWANAAYARRDAAANGAGQGWPQWTECWGFTAAADTTFHLLSQLPPNAVLGEPLTYGDVADGVLGM